MATGSSVWGIILASSPPGDFPADIEPVFLTLGSKPVLSYSLSAFERCPEVEGLVLVASKDRLESVRSLVHLFGCNKVKATVAGAAGRLESIQAGLEVAEEHRAGVIVIHDGARPGVTPEAISETIRQAKRCGVACVAHGLADPLVETARGTKLTGIPEGDQFLTTATPHAFKADALQKTLAHAARKKLKSMDEIAVAFAAKLEIQLVALRRPMVRIASPIELNLAEFYLRH